jgi:hypothetical protein
MLLISPFIFFVLFVVVAISTLPTINPEVKGEKFVLTLPSTLQPTTSPTRKPSSLSAKRKVEVRTDDVDPCNVIIHVKMYGFESNSSIKITVGGVERTCDKQVLLIVKKSEYVGNTNDSGIIEFELHQRQFGGFYLVIDDSSDVMMMINVDFPMLEYPPQKQQQNPQPQA